MAENLKTSKQRNKKNQILNTAITFFWFIKTFKCPKVF